MKKIIFILIFLISSAVFSKAFTSLNRITGERMSIEEAKKIWGQSSFNEEQFKKGDSKVKAAMVYELIQSKKYIGASNLEIRKKLGPFEGHFFNESFPTYMLGATIKGDSKELRKSWQLLFLVDRDGMVKDVVIHKNCCYE